MRRDRAYETLNEKLRTYLRDSENEIDIDINDRDRIWRNINNQIREKEIKRKYRIRRSCKVAITVCIMIVAVISIDLSSNASLFRRFLTSISGNTIQLNTRGSEVYEENRDPHLDKEIERINQEKETQFIAPPLINSYTFNCVEEDNSTITIKFQNESKDFIKVIQKHVEDGDSSTNASYNNDLFKMSTLNKNGIEYNKLIGDKINIVIFLVGDIEIKVVGKNADSILEVAYLIAE